MVTRRKGLLVGVDGLHLRGMEINDRRDGESTTLLSKGLFRTPTISLAMTARMLFSAMSTGMSTTMREDMTETINSMSKQFVRSAITTGRMPAVGDKTEIAWCDATWNPMSGCTRVSEGCRHCYIDRTPPFRMNGRKFVNGTTGVQLHPDRLDQPLKWKKPRRIFVNSLSDLFHEDVPFEFITAVFGVMAASPMHTFQVLTKRPERMRAWCSFIQKSGGLGLFIRTVRVDGDRTIPNYFNQVMRTAIYRGNTHRAMDDPWMQVFNAAACIGDGQLPNVWLGVSVENQRTADERIPLLLNTPAAIRFISYEPALGPVVMPEEWLMPAFSADDDRYHHPGGRGLDWVILGGESGPGARPCHVAWIRSIVQQCQAAKVPVFVKQLGSSVVDRNDAGFEGDTDESWPMDTKFEQEWSERNYQGTLGRVRLKKKGGDWNEWPADLRVREYPTKGARHE